MPDRITSFLKRSTAHLPSPLRRAAAALDYAAASRVRTYRDPQHLGFPRLDRGVVIFSVDFELAWAWQYANNLGEEPVIRGLRERDQVPGILAAFDRYAVPATWATVGHLFLERCCRDQHGHAHPEMPRLPHFTSEQWTFGGGDWYQHDPCTDVRRDPAWYGPDLIEQILRAGAGHEVACHGFSHAGFGPYCPAEVAEAEIDACRRAMAPFGLEPETLVYPANDEGNFASVARRGVRIVRAFPGPRAHLTLPVRRDDGMWGLHASSALDRGATWSLPQRLRRLEKIVDAAISTKLSAHFWFHPSMPPEEMRLVFEPLLRYCAERREQGLLHTLTMKQMVTMISPSAGPAAGLVPGRSPS